ncbi:MAG: hypothetical protein CSA11_03875 [Chloroflexi bacterium]|nr:MAG: hypothetical protein CSA11_03875 [Chloroflexota bacterium]
MLQKILKLKFIILLCILIGSFFIIDNLVITNEVSGQETSYTYLPVIQNNYDGSLGTPIFGVQMYGSTSSPSVNHPSLLDSKTSWIRVPITWESVEPTEANPPIYQWDSVNNKFAASRSDMGQFNLIGTFHGEFPNWAKEIYTSPPGVVISPDKRDDFAEFVAAVVERYDGDGVADAPGSPVILHWEIFNEPDEALVNPKWGNYGAEYAHLLSLVYPAVKAANPEAQILFGGIAYDWFDDQGGKFNREFLSDVLAAGGGAYFDVMNYHSYPAFSENWTTNGGSGLLEKGQAIRATLASYGYAKPLVITEAGWHDNSPVEAPSSPEVQARYVVQLLTQSYAAKLDTMIWWLLYDVGGNYPYNTGLVTSQGSEKISFTTYQEVVNELSTAHFVRKLPTSETHHANMEVYEFHDKTKNLTIYVAWLNPVNTSSLVSLRLPGTTALVKESIPNQVGGNFATYSVQDGSDGFIDGQFIISVGGRPLYIEVQQ